jgi:hypothetical protein
MKIQTFDDSGGRGMEKKSVKHIVTLNQANLNSLPSFGTRNRENATECFFRFVDKNPLLADNEKSSVRAVILSGRKTRSRFETFSGDLSGMTTGVIARYSRYFDNK